MFQPWGRRTIKWNKKDSRQPQSPPSLPSQTGWLKRLFQQTHPSQSNAMSLSPTSTRGLAMLEGYSFVRGGSSCRHRSMCRSHTWKIFQMGLLQEDRRIPKIPHTILWKLFIPPIFQRIQAEHMALPAVVFRQPPCWRKLGGEWSTQGCHRCMVQCEFEPGLPHS